MSDIADAVAVGPSALYRHFPGKQQLLKRVVFDGLGAVRALLAQTDFADPGAALPMLAEVTIANRHVGLLLERESRHLPQEDQGGSRAAQAGTRPPTA
jgi:AcrR family transcriptional regulator